MYNYQDDGVLAVGESKVIKLDYNHCTSWSLQLIGGSSATTVSARMLGAERFAVTDSDLDEGLYTGLQGHGFSELKLENTGAVPVRYLLVGGANV